MTIDRRRFLLGTGLAATAPALAGLLSLPAMGQRLEASSRDALVSVSGTVPGPANVDVAFGIEGWPVGDAAPDGETVLFSINQSWRSAWR